MENKQAIIDLALDLGRGTVTKFSADEANEVLRKSLNEVAGDYKTFRRNPWALFEIIEEVLDAQISAGLKNSFDQFVDYKDLNLGDKNEFVSPIREAFRVDSIAAGTNNLRRQRLGARERFSIDTAWKGVKIYEELERFLAGRIDWMDIIDNVDRSFQDAITTDIFTAVKAAYNGVAAPFSHTGNWDLDEFNLIVEHVRAATGVTPMVIGSRLAVSKALPNANYISDSMKDSRNNTGFFQTVDGVEFGIIPQSHKPGTYEFAIDDDFLLILPNGNEKMIKFVNEGETLITENTEVGANADDSIEYVVRRKYGTGVVSSDLYGVYILR